MIATIFAATIVEGALSSLQFLVFSSLAAGGLIVLGVGTVFGGHHGEVGHDAGHADHGAHVGGHESSISFLSPRIFSAFMTGFGAAGAIATAYGGGPGTATAIGFVPGLTMAIFAWSVAYYLFKAQVSSSIRPGQVVGAAGTVVTAIQSGGLGEANISVNGQIVPYAAMSEDGTTAVMAGTPVWVVRDLGDKVTVRKQTAAIGGEQAA